MIALLLMFSKHLPLSRSSFDFLHYDAFWKCSSQKNSSWDLPTSGGMAYSPNILSHFGYSLIFLWQSLSKSTLFLPEFIAILIFHSPSISSNTKYSLFVREYFSSTEVKDCDEKVECLRAGTWGRLTRQISWRESDIEHPTRMKYSLAILQWLADVLWLLVLVRDFSLLYVCWKPNTVERRQCRRLLEV